MRLTPLSILLLAIYTVNSWAQTSVPDILKRSAQAREQLIEGLKQGIVRVEVGAEAGQPVRESGTGFILSASPDRIQILTALHVVKNARTINVVFYSDKTVRVPARKLKDHSEALDVAVIEVRPSPGVQLPKDIQPIRFTANPTLEPMSHIWSVNGEWIPVPNSVTKLDHDHDPQRFEYTNVSVGEGFSGGPVFNDYAEVVGMHVASGHEGYVVAIKIDFVLQTLKALGYNVPKPEPGLISQLSQPGTVAPIGPAKPTRVSQLMVNGTFQPAGLPSGPAQIILTPNAGSTYTATFTGAGLMATFTNGTASANDQVFTFNSLQQGRTAALLDGKYFVASGGSLTLSVNQTNSGATASTGNVSGSVNLVGTASETRPKPAYGRAAPPNDAPFASAKLSGQIIGTYTAMLVPKDMPVPPTAPVVSSGLQIPAPAASLPRPAAAAPVSIRERQMAETAFRRGQYYAAMPVYRRLADEGDSTAMANVGTMYELGGEGVPKDLRQAAQWHLKAAEAGNPAAMQTIGLDYMVANGVPLDYAKAAEWLQRAAEAGQPMAMGAIGVLYAYGRGVPKNLDQAAFWLRKAAAAGDETAKQQLQKLGIR